VAAGRGTQSRLIAWNLRQWSLTRTECWNRLLAWLPNQIFWIDRKAGVAATVFQQLIPVEYRSSINIFREFKYLLYEHLRTPSIPAHAVG